MKIKKEKINNKRAISLIVLVITIIVMIVLAGAIILSLNNAGIIEKANQAVKDTDEATAKELAQMAWAEAYADGVRSVKDTVVDGKTIEGFETRVNKALTDSGIDTDKYIVSVTNKGADVQVATIPWVQDGLKVVRGKDELTIGQIVNYDETNGGTTTVERDVKWQVLGVDDNGNLLIVSASYVKGGYSLDSNTLIKAQQAWISGGVNDLNSVCAAYGKGSHAIGARSITVEDIDKITGYDKTTFANSVIYKYGNEVTYSYTGDEYPSFKATNGKEGALTTIHSNGFYWYDGSTFQHVSVDELKKEENVGKEITTITNTYYTYAGTKKLSAETDAYKMIFGTTATSNYWLASPCVITFGTAAQYAFQIVREGSVAATGLLKSNGEASTYKMGVRAVVTLRSNVSMASLLEE